VTSVAVTSFTVASCAVTSFAVALALSVRPFYRRYQQSFVTWQ
jgi:hypothetical protein